ncbi:FxSxx-COOH system tetratricopeptide repeat protein [Streptomyces sp. AK010]|uniref:FxSxx-COOH system tetratricopeptide repeat protein n=1 Tax=Streptomyces sp. AK010 TaxID=2723074 RepID=UPI0016216766|nr:FxSxx-COOH system tetratricopeptide repeat protein [Streptomyces sp. AK010]
MMARRSGRIITFYSYKGGTGRTMALANTAWILAANGARVLAVDWDLEAPGLHRFFHPFLDPSTLEATPGVIDMISEYSWAATSGSHRSGTWHRQYARAGRHAVSLNPKALGLSFSDGGSLDFLSAGQQNRAYSATVSSFEWDNFYDRLGGGIFLDALREDMKASYDYVLIDSRTGLSDSADICTIQMPDVLVDCFTLSDQALDGGAAVARTVEADYRDRRIRVLPVPMRVDEGEKEKADAGRALARLKFDGLPKGKDGEPLDPAQLNEYWGAVEIPYRPYYAYEELLAAIGDQSGVSSSLLSAFERLTEVISDGEVTRLPPIPEPVRQRCLAAYTRRRPTTLAADVFVVFTGEDRMWAEWLEGTLKPYCSRVTLHDVAIRVPERPDPATRALILTSDAFLQARHGRAAWRALTDSAPGLPALQVTRLRLDRAQMPGADVEYTSVDLHRADEAECVQRVFKALNLTTDLVPTGTASPRFPGNWPRIFNAPSRNTLFTGRAAVLEQLRSQLGEGISVVLPQPQTLFGLGGVGKTQIVLEYVHRFVADYDLVWWISAEHKDAIIASLAELGSRIGASGGDDMALASAEVVQMLASGAPTTRWLLVFDNADDPETLKRYFPAGGGHILVTSRNQAWAQQGASLSVDVFPREESIEHLTRQAPGLTVDEADRVADAVGDLPLAVEQAAAWLAETATPTDEYLRQLTEQTTAVLGLNHPKDYPQPVAATWNISIARLKERSPASVRLLQLCAFMAPEPISVRVLYNKEMLDALREWDPSLQESLLLGRVIREIGRFALAKVDQSSGSIQVHRLVQAVIRSQLSEAEREEARHVVHTVLASARPDGDEPTDDPSTWPLFDSIWSHLLASGIQDCSEPEPRRLLIDRVRYLWKRGDLPSARQLAEEVLERWIERLGENDMQCLYLRCQLANVLRSQGRYLEARKIDEELLERQREVLGSNHPHTYITASSLASDLAALGEYRSAVELAEAAHRGFRDIFHESHQRTLSAANNLALALRMVGRYDDARAVDQDVYDRRLVVLGPTHPYTLGSASSLGRDLREIGRYDEAVEILSRVYEDHKRILGEHFPSTLSCAKSLAVSLRRVGRVEDALRLTTATLARYREQYSSPNPDWLACDLNLASDLYAADEKEQAREVARQALAGYMKVPGEAHPYTQGALNNLGIFHWGCGDLAEAEEVFRRVLPRLKDMLGKDHPHTLISGLNFANVLADQGRFEEAYDLESKAASGLGAVLGRQHPDTLTAVANSALTLSSLGSPEADRLREESLGELRRLLGDEVMNMRSVRHERRLYRDLEPLAV